MTILSAALLLFLVMDPIGNIPLFLVALQGFDRKRRQRIILRELLFALAALLLFFFAGPYLLSLLNISDSALTTAGGIILFLIAIKMIFPATMGRLGQDDLELGGEPFIVPLAIPFIAGPSALASVLFVVGRDTSRWPEWLLALLLAWLVSGLILFAASPLSERLGKRGIVAMERLMGMILTAMAAEMMMNGVAQFLRHLP